MPPLRKFNRLNAMAPRTTFLVAAVNALAVEKRKADYLCDGVNDEEQINAAFTEIGTNFTNGSGGLCGGGTVQLSSGNFVIGGTINIQSGQYLHGKGIRATRITQANGANLTNLIRFLGATYGTGLEAMSINGNKDSNTTGNGIYIDDTAYMNRLRNLEIVQCPQCAVRTVDSSTLGGLDSPFWESVFAYNCGASSDIFHLYGVSSGAQFIRVGGGHTGVRDPWPTGTIAVMHFIASSEVHGTFETFGMPIGMMLEDCRYCDIDSLLCDVCADYGLYLTPATLARNDRHHFNSIEVYAVGQNAGKGIAVGVNTGTRIEIESLRIYDGLGRRSFLPYSDIGTRYGIVETGVSNYNRYGSIIAQTKIYLKNTLVGDRNKYESCVGSIQPISGFEMNPITTPAETRKVTSLLNQLSMPSMILPPTAIGATNFVDYAGNITIQSKAWGEKVLAYQGGVYIDETAAAREGTAGDLHFLAALPVVGDCYYIGRNNIFGDCNFSISQAGVGVWTIIWEYYSSVTNSWKTIPGFVDGTLQFQAGPGVVTVSFTPPNDWIKNSFGSGTYYWLRARVTNFVSIVTQPLGTSIALTAVPQYWDTPMSMMGKSLLIRLNGTSEAVVLYDNPLLSFGTGIADTPFTMICIGKFTALAAIQTIMAKWSTNNPFREWQWTLDAAGHMRFDLYDESLDKNPFRLSDNPVDRVAVHAWAVTYDGSGGATAADGIIFYKDGAVIASTATNDGAYVSMENLGNDAYIGMSQGAANIPTNMAEMDCGWFIILPNALTAGQIRAISDELRAACEF